MIDNVSLDELRARIYVLESKLRKLKRNKVSKRVNQLRIEQHKLLLELKDKKRMKKA